MNRAEYINMYLHEDYHWWYVGLRELIHEHISGIGPDTVLLDIGCGAGGVLKNMSPMRSISIGESEAPLYWDKRRGISELVRGDIRVLPFKDESVDIVISSDKVMFGRNQTSDEELLQELRRVLKPNGILFLNIPTVEIVKGELGNTIYTRRGCAISVLKRTVGSSGFTIKKISYRNFFLLIHAILFRFMERQVLHRTGVNLFWTHDISNYILRQIMRLENLMLKKLNLPFGESVFCAAEKSD